MGCSTPESLGGPGAPCAVVTDCQEGLVCITQSGSVRQCSNDLAAIQFVEEAGAPAANGAEGGEATGGGSNDATTADDAPPGQADAGPGDQSSLTDASADDDATD